jgi:hypothetical protein
MIGLGLGLTFIGYSLTYYGLTQLRGGNWGLLDLVVPGRWAKAQSTPTDSGMGGSGSERANAGSKKKPPNDSTVSPSMNKPV